MRSDASACVIHNALTLCRLRNQPTELACTRKLVKWNLMLQE